MVHAASPFALSTNCDTLAQLINPSTFQNLQKHFDVYGIHGSYSFNYLHSDYLLSMVPKPLPFSGIHYMSTKANFIWP